MNYVMNWIQEDNFDLLHNMQGAKFRLLQRIRDPNLSQSALYARSKVYRKLKINCFARKNECTGVLLALHANNWLYGRIFHNSRIFLQNINISDRIRFKRIKTAQYCRFVSKFWTGMSVNEDAEQDSRYKRWSTSIAPRLCCVCALQSLSVCFTLQMVQSASLHSFKLLFLVSARN